MVGEPDANASAAAATPELARPSPPPRVVGSGLWPLGGGEGHKARSGDESWVSSLSLLEGEEWGHGP